MTLGMIQHVLRALLACFDQLLQYLLYGVVHELCRLVKGEGVQKLPILPSKKKTKWGGWVKN